MKFYGLENIVTEPETPGVSLAKMVRVFRSEYERDSWVNQPDYRRYRKPLTKSDNLVIMIEQDGRDNKVWVL